MASTSPMEMHLVHTAAAGKLAVVGVLIDESAHNKAFEPVWANLPKQKGMKTHYSAVTLEVEGLLPVGAHVVSLRQLADDAAVSEGVSWIVMSTPIRLSAAQIGVFMRADSRQQPPDTTLIAAA